MERTQKVIRVLVVDEHEVVRRGVIRVLALDDGLRVVGEAASVSEAVARSGTARPDVAVVGMRLPDGTGADVCARLGALVPEVRCLVLSAYGDAPTVRAALRAGVSGYLLKDLAPQRLVSAVRRVAAGGTAFGEAVTALSSRCAPEADPLELLTARERAVLRLIGEGLTNRQIAARLGLAEKTVKNYVTHLLLKLGVERRTQAAILVTRLVTPPTAEPRTGRRDLGSACSRRSRSDVQTRRGWLPVGGAS